MADSQTVHGHEIIHLIRDASPALTWEQLRTEAERRFGAEARFHTCSAEGMTLGELLEFLLIRGKVIQQEGRLHAVMSNVCSHEP